MRLIIIANQLEIDLLLELEKRNGTLISCSRSVPKVPGCNILPVELDDALFERYRAFCSASLWPILHSIPESVVYSGKQWNAYKDVNDSFARKAVGELSQNVTTNVWITDYRLLLTANTIRSSGFNCKLGFFFRIPFPSWDVFRLYSKFEDVLQGLLSNDVVGFQAGSHCSNFIQSCRLGLCCQTDEGNRLVYYGGRVIKIVHFPVGIPYDTKERMARESGLATVESGLKFILSIDTLDSTTGILNRLLGFELLLKNRPDLLEKLVMLQIVQSSTDSAVNLEKETEIKRLIARIENVRYVDWSLTEEELAAHYRDASVALMTPFRDGANGFAEAFVACQVKQPPGVLILSPGSGSSESMKEALLCNPYSVDDIADKLERALAMPDDERTLRMNYLKEREKRQNIENFTSYFIKSMDDLRLCLPTGIFDFEKHCGRIITPNKKLCLLFDYDGTLSPLVERPDLAKFPETPKRILQTLSTHPQIYVSIVSGRGVENVKEMVGIPNITYAGNHGHEIIYSSGKRFVYPMPREFEERVAKLCQDFESICRDGAWIENKGATLTFHYRAVPEQLKRDLIVRAQAMIQAAGFRASSAHCALEAKPPIDWHKGRACVHILKEEFGLDWGSSLNVIFAGDDTTDEDAMTTLQGMALTFRVTRGLPVNTAATYRLVSTDCVVQLLKWIENKFFTKQ